MQRDDELLPCHSRCVVKGTEKNDSPSLMGATHGNFCDKEHFATITALRLVAEVVEHVVSLVNSQSRSDDNVQSSREAPLPFNVTAFNDANEMYQRLVYWTDHWAGVLKRQSPGPAKRAWRAESGRIVGLPADIAPARARYETSVMSIWLQAHLDDIFWQVPADDVLFFHDEMKSVFTIAARWPSKMRARFAKIPCPQCGQQIAVYPPNEKGDEMRIVCGFGHMYDEDSFEFYVREFKQIQDEMAKAEKTRKRLVKKYAA